MNLHVKKLYQNLGKGLKCPSTPKELSFITYILTYFHIFHCGFCFNSLLVAILDAQLMVTILEFDL